MTENREETTAAVVVTYNRKALLVQCVEALLQQSHPLDAIVIVDNCSVDGTYDELLSRSLIGPVSPSAPACESIQAAMGPNRRAEVHYVRMPENTGGAGGFHEGIRRGLDTGFDWLWLMDDDLLPSVEALQALVAQRETLQTAGKPAFLLNSLILSKADMDDDTLALPLQELTPGGHPKIGVYYHHLSEIKDKLEDGLYRWACPFNGTLIPTAALAQIGLPNKDFFIWGDERDFLWRAAKVLDLYTVVDSKAYHPRFTGLTFNWKLYYHIRNSFVVNEHFNLTALRNLKLVITSLALGLRHGRKGLALVRRAIRDGLARNLGKRQDLHP